MKSIAQLVHALSWVGAFALVDQPPEHPNQHNRRRFLDSTIGGGMMKATFVGVGSESFLLSQSAWAAPPVTQGEADNVGARALRFLRVKPPRMLRPKLNRDFAVLLMRSSYNVLDALDCVAMDQFQRDFFLIRQAEYQPYVNYLGPGMVQQGDLSDPYYFDFISFAQYLTINREIALDPPFVFEERQPIEVDEDDDGQAPQQFVTRVVRRDPSLTNALLAPEHSQRVGQSILNYIDAVLGDTGAGLPKVPTDTARRPPLDQVLASFDQLVKIFVINGFAWDGKATASPGSSEFTLTLNAPATLWSSQSLQQQRATLTNHFLLKAASQLARRLGYLVVGSSVRYDGSNEVTQIQLR